MKFINIVEKTMCYCLINPFAQSIYKNVERVSNWFSYRLFLRKVIKEHGIDLIIDVGANKGQFASKTRLLYAGQIISFEPVNKAYEALSNASKQDQHWDAYNLALGRKAGFETINISDDSVFNSFLKTNEYCSDRFGAESISKSAQEVEIQRLDDFLLAHIPNINQRKIFLKMDTQGFDLEVFHGASKLINNIHLIQTEVSVAPIYDGMVSWVDSMNTMISAKFSVVNMFPVNRDGNQVVEYDCLLEKMKR